MTRLFLVISLSIFLTGIGLNAADGAAPGASCAVDLATAGEVTGGNGPVNITVSPSEVAGIRVENSSFYSSAKEFASAFGSKFGNLVASHLPAEGKATIVIAMGGAEHLGTLLEMYLKQNGLSDRVDFKYVNLSTSFLKPWYAQKLRGNDILERSGIGEPPAGYSVLANDSDPRKIDEYLLPFDLFSNKKVLVVDTGFRGTTAEAIASIANMELYGGKVEGILLAHASDAENTIPVVGLNEVQNDPTDKKNIIHWANAIDNNNVQGAQFAWSNDAFQRSTINHKGKDDKKSGDTRTSKKLLHNYKATLLGLQDGLNGSSDADSSH